MLAAPLACRRHNAATPARSLEHQARVRPRGASRSWPGRPRFRRLVLERDRGLADHLRVERQHPRGVVRRRHAQRLGSSVRRTLSWPAPMIQAERAGAVTTLRLAHKKASALDLELCRELERRSWSSPRATRERLVLTGTGSIFSAGVDLVRLLRRGRPVRLASSCRRSTRSSSVCGRSRKPSSPRSTGTRSRAARSSPSPATCGSSPAATARFRRAPELVVRRAVPAAVSRSRSCARRVGAGLPLRGEVVTLGRLFDPESCLAKGPRSPTSSASGRPVAGRSRALVPRGASSRPFRGRTMVAAQALSRATGAGAPRRRGAAVGEGGARGLVRPTRRWRRCGPNVQRTLRK
jgi:hypothetical protein